MPLFDHLTARRLVDLFLCLVVQQAYCRVLLADQPSKTSSAPIHFGRDVRPILAKHCFTCHGPDENAREAGLRLDTQEGSRADLGGYQAIAPSKPRESELLLRVTSDDPDLRMPPAESHPALTTNEVQVLEQWIESGANYEVHWAFVSSERPSIPTVEDPRWCRGPIDRFVLSRMQQAGLSPSEPATPTALLRRVYLDLVGTTPSPEAVSDFMSDPRDDAYERLVDRLLASPEYGERFARPWLDLARYSDTNGYEKDRSRTIWPFRDWVINAINQDQSFDQFSIEQIAGDMLPGATRQQKIATGFHRNTMLNEEGGIDPLEYRFYAMVDRVATTGTVWMGLTTGCAQCHTHKYDPITHTDYYALMALMDDADEPELNADPDEVANQRKRIEQRIEELERSIAAELLSDPNQQASRIAYEKWRSRKIASAVNWIPLPPIKTVSTLPRLSVQDDASVLASGDATKRDVYTLTMPATDSGQPITAVRIEALPHSSLPATGPGLAFYEGRRGDFFLSELKLLVDGNPIELAAGSTSVPGSKPGNGKVYPGNVLDGNGSTGWSIPGDSGQTHRLVIPLKEPMVLDSPWQLELLFERHYVAGLGHFRIDVTSDEEPTASSLPSSLQNELAKQSGVLDDLLQEKLAIEYVRETKQLRAPIDQLRSQLPKTVRTLVMQERSRDDGRTTHRHHRGEYLQPKETVDPNVPALFLGSTGEDEPPSNRLQLARWLVSDKNPLVGRVTANRAWRQFFGTGIVRTAGDFGTQSEPPSHPDLIAWLDCQLRDDGASGGRWSLKKLHRQIVLSSTYRQSVGSPPQEDPNNRLLSVFPYRRFDAERIRDAFLSASGLLARRIGGESVYPPQPASVVAMAYGKTSWPTAQGENRFRRSLYTFSKRTAPFAAFTTFDAPSGELCIARRDRSTTPLQALTLLNDEMYLEIADGLAKQTLREADSSSPRLIAKRMFQRLLVRSPTEDEVESIIEFYESQSQHPDPWMLVARALLNTDEAITTP